MAASRKYVYPAIGIYAFGTYGAMLFLRSQQAGNADDTPGRTWDEIADGYDGELGLDETLMGLKLCRWWLIRQARGDVLEVSAGTGRNLPYYSYKQLSSLTLTDSSKYMLWHAAQKWRERQAAQAGASLPVRFLLTDAQQLACDPQQLEGGSNAARHAEPEHGGECTARGRGQEEAAAKEAARVSAVFATRAKAFPERSFDSVVDTFGLCSHADPIAVLKEMARVCKPEGRILLLEHGRAGHDWLNSILDRGEQKHLKKWGCRWNRDIEDLVAQAGLEVESISRWHFGTTYIIVAKPAAA